MLKHGTIISDRYRIDRFIDSGQMGEVYAATRLYDELKVAIKLIHPRWVNSQEQIERFRLEVVAARKVEHPAVVKVFDVGEYGARPFIVMEFLRGTSLADYLASGSLRRRDAFEVIRAALEPLAKAHDVDVVHRDFKPENIFVVGLEDADDRVKLLDFGIARELGSVSKTRTGMTMGTPLYMSPEQAADPKNVRFASDIWASGVMLYRFATGRYPFMGTTPTALLIATVIEPHTPADSPEFNLPVQLSVVIERCLEKDPAKRYANGAQLLQALTACLKTPTVNTWLSDEVRLQPDPDEADEGAVPEHVQPPQSIGGKETMPALDGQTFKGLTDRGPNPAHGTSNEKQADEYGSKIRPNGPSASSSDDLEGMVGGQGESVKNIEMSSTEAQSSDALSADGDIATWHQEHTSSDELEETVIHLMPNNTTEFDDSTSRIETDIELLGQLPPVNSTSNVRRYLLAISVIALAATLGLLVRSGKFAPASQKTKITLSPKPRLLSGDSAARLPEPSTDETTAAASPIPLATTPASQSPVKGGKEPVNEPHKSTDNFTRSTPQRRMKQPKRIRTPKKQASKARVRQAQSRSRTHIQPPRKQQPARVSPIRSAPSALKTSNTLNPQKPSSTARVTATTLAPTKQQSPLPKPRSRSAAKTMETQRLNPSPVVRPVRGKSKKGLDGRIGAGKAKPNKLQQGSSDEETDVRKANGRPFMSF